MSSKKWIVGMLMIVFLSIGAFSQTQRIAFEAPLMYPEGVAFNSKTNMFFVSSVTTGTIGTVDEKGNYTLFYQDSLLKSSFGMKVDVSKNRLLVCVSDPNYSRYSSPATFKKMARLLIFDLNTRKKIADIDLAALNPGKHFANDLTLDDKGNIYVTDSFFPVIYKVDLQNNAVIFAKSDFFQSEDVGLNGIVYHPGGFLLVAHNTTGALFKVDIKDPKMVSKVKMNTFFPGADGLLLDDQNNLILIQNKGVNKAFQIASPDNWISAKVKSATAATDRFHNPTTGAIQNGKIWLLNSKMNELSDSTMAPSKEFSLQLVKLEAVE